MRVAIATCAEMPPGFDDDALLEGELARRGAEAERVPWDADTDWDAFDAVVIRTTWDYARRRDEFLRWADRIDGRLHNGPDLVRWNSDKRYLADLERAGVPVVETAFLEPETPMPVLSGEVVVKPNVSAGGRDTGRFGPAHSEEAAELVRRIHASGRIAMVQPYQASVDAEGETAVVFIGGEPSHALLKNAVLRPDEVAPVREDWVGAAEAMYDPELVVAGAAADDELELARRVVAHLAERFGRRPLYARVDLVRDPEDRARVLELEAIEPNLYFDEAPGAVHRLAEAILEVASAETPGAGAG
ncbi:MAG TPA: hypothetical protein VK326_12020 [Solirubrobacterales bacterium]|nr:hypothetical protein [Solirubrobacterales bacterium]